MAMYCNYCQWLGHDLTEGVAHVLDNPGHDAATLDPTWAEAEANRCEDEAAQLISKANELRRKAGLISA